MEEILKELQNKCLTKKTLFDFLSGINIEELSKNDEKNTTGIEEENKLQNIIDNIVVKRKKSSKMFKCESCMKSFISIESLNNHQEKFSICKEWTKFPEKIDINKLTKGIHLIVEDILEHSLTSEDNLKQCKYCKAIFTNRGNLHKHYNYSSVCNRMAFIQFKENINKY